jgi:2-polyprenyl-6-methoxyphenol hydroxylase-like FAD-dependent oxidoreductase
MYELREHSVSEGGGLTLTPNALKILDLLGAYECVHGTGYRFRGIVVRTESNVEIAQNLLGGEKLFGYDAIRTQRNSILVTLRRMVEERGMPIHYGRQFSHVVAEGAAGVVFEFKDGSRESASLLIGADGIHSRVRPFIHPMAQTAYTGVMCLLSTADRRTFRFPSTKDADTCLPTFIAGKTGALILVPQSADGNTVAVMSHHEHPDVGRAGWDALRSSPEQLMAMQMKNKQHSSDFVQSVLESIQPDTMSIWPFHYLPRVDTWMSPAKRVILIGDAAHAMPPTSGQGIGSGLEDAYSLALLLARADSTLPFDAAVDWWQSFRMERTDAILKLNLVLTEKRRPIAHQRKDESDWTGKIEGMERRHHSWLYQPNIAERTLAWIEREEARQSRPLL